MRVEVPDTPVFHAELEGRLRAAASAGTRTRRRPVSVTALRAMRELNVGSLHVAFAVAVAAVFLLLSPTSVLDEGQPLVPEHTETVPGFIRQYATDDDVAAFVARARAQGHEVVVVTDYVAAGSPAGTIIDVRMIGDPDDAIASSNEPRSPIVVVMGIHVSAGSSIAD
jgi:hypothetical protein